MAAVPVAAHHALAAQYDMDKPIEITGTLNKMEFINPHSMLHLDVKNPDGTVTTWVFQTTNAGSLRSQGLARTDRSLESGATYTSRASRRATATRWASCACWSSRTRRK